MKKFIKKLKQLSEKQKIWIIFGVVVLLSIKLSHWTGDLYEVIIGRQLHEGGGLFYTFECDNCFSGFLFTFVLFSVVSFFGFLDKNRLKISIYSILLIPLLMVFGKDGEGLIAVFTLSLIGLALGQLIHLARKKLIKK